MAKATVLGMLTKPHDGFAAAPAIEGSDFVTIDGIPVVCLGDAYDVHCDKSGSCHGGKAEQGSSFVFIDGDPVMRKGDKLDCGAIVDEAVDWVDINA